MGGNETAHEALALAGNRGIKAALSYNARQTERLVILSKAATKIGKYFGPTQQTINWVVNEIEETTGKDGWKAIINNWYWIDKKAITLPHPITIETYCQSAAKVIEEQTEKRRTHG